MRKPHSTSQVLSRALTAILLAQALDMRSLGGTLEAPFTRLTTGPWTESATSISVAAGDFDNDGWPDLFVGQLDSACSLFRNDHGNFTKITDSPVATQIGSVHAAACADFDNDGWLDLVVASLVDAPKPATLLFHGQGNGAFERVTTGALAEDTGRAAAVAWADYNGDGMLDLFVGRGALARNISDSMYSNQGLAGFSVDNSIGFGALRTCQGTWADFDGDGDLDLLVVHAGLQGNMLYRNLGHGQFELVTSSGLSQLGESVGAAWGDYDNDGDLDLIINNFSFNGPQSNFLYRNKGDGTFTKIPDGPIALDTGYFMSCSWVDFDNDGWLDLFVSADPMGDPNGRRNRLYHNLGNGTFERMTTGSLVTDIAQFGGASWLDYNNDGFPDVYIACGVIYGPEPDAFYRNRGNANSWIKVRCVGTISNRSAIGTKIRVKARIAGADRWQMRQIVGTEGWLSFNSLDQIIGLGDATAIDTLRVEWPSGTVQEWHNVAVSQTLVIVEKTTLDIVRGNGSDLQVTIAGPRQQKYALETSTNLRDWSRLASLTITNADGTANYTGKVDEQPERYFRAKAE